MDFADRIQRKELADFDGLAVPVIALDDLIRNKRASGRHKDLADIEGLNRDVPEWRRLVGAKEQAMGFGFGYSACSKRRASTQDFPLQK